MNCSQETLDNISNISRYLAYPKGQMHSPSPSIKEIGSVSTLTKTCYVQILQITYILVV